MEAELRARRGADSQRLGLVCLRVGAELRGHAASWLGAAASRKDSDFQRKYILILLRRPLLAQLALPSCAGSTENLGVGGYHH